MEWIKSVLPNNINTGILIGGIIALYKSVMFTIGIVKKRKDTQKEFEKEVLEKERVRSKFDSRLKKVEDEIVSIRDDFKQKNAENKEDFIILSKKIDKILDILIKPPH